VARDFVWAPIYFRDLASEHCAVAVRSLTLALEAAAAPPSLAQVEVRVLSGPERVRRAALGLGAGLALALVALPIPVVHFVLVPGALTGGLALAAARLTQRETFLGAEGRCPYCGLQQRFMLLGRFRLPKRVYCSACQRELYLAPAS
jgi:hypothetical protein